MIKRISILFLGLGILLSLIYCAYRLITQHNFNPKYQVGDVIDSLNGVEIYYNGGVNTSDGRNLSIDGYNLGIKYQCVEFVKRYFYQRHQHKMPDTYGHARDFFDNSLADGAWNEKRAMLQYVNGSQLTPQADDLLVLLHGFLIPMDMSLLLLRSMTIRLKLFSKIQGLLDLQENISH